MTVHEFSPLMSGATLHAIDGGVRYVKVDWIMREELTGRPEFYCATDDWETTPAGRLATKDKEIAALQRYIADLERRLAEAAPSVPIAVAVAATGMRDEAAHGLVCPDCGQNSFKNDHALRVHRGRAHREGPAATTPRPTVTIVALDDSVPWRCERCRSDAHARSLTQPGLCLRCAAQRNCGEAAA